MHNLPTLSILFSVFKKINKIQTYFHMVVGVVMFSFYIVVYVFPYQVELSFFC